jgi:hypothetical protein
MFINLRKYCFEILFLAFFLITTIVLGQTSNSISSINLGEIKDNTDLEIKATLINSSSIARVQIIYKSFQETDFRVREMELMGDVATYTIDAEDVSAPTLSYYLLIEKKNGTKETYPLGVPEAARPIDLVVSTLSEKDREVLILSPGAGESINIKEVFVSISLVKAPDNIDIPSTKIIINGKDISNNVMFAGDLLLFYPQNFEGSMEIGEQNLEIEVYNKDGELYHTVKRKFSTIDALTSARMGSGLRLTGNVVGEVRNEAFNENTTLYNNMALSLNAEIGDWKFKGYGYVTSEEKDNIQAQNRFSASVSSSWLNLRGGDSYPRYNNLLLNGKRVRGVDGRIDYGLFHFQGTYGQARRKIEGLLLETYSSDAAPLRTNVIRIDSAKYGNEFGAVNFGVHSRDLLSGRLGVGSQNGFEFGVSFLHAKDDVNSIEFGSRPQENLVASTDLRLALDDQHIILKGVSAISVLNSNITSGTYTDSEIDSIFANGDELGDDVDNFKEIKNIISPFMTVNQFIEPINPTELSSVAAEGSLELNYFNNAFKGSYIYRGNQFVSFGQEYTRTDIAGLNLTDRFRTLDNQLFLTIGYENLSDNLQGTKVATTTFQTIRASASLFLRENFPSITLSYTNNRNENGINVSDTVNSYLGVDDITNRASINIGYDFNLKVKHNTSLSFMTSDRQDNSFYDNDADYLSTAFTLNSYWTRALVSNFSVIYYSSHIAGVAYEYVSLSMGSRYLMMNDDLELSLNYSPSFGDFSRHAIDLVIAYQIIPKLWTRGQMRYYTVPDISANTIAGVTLSYNF